MPTFNSLFMTTNSLRLSNPVDTFYTDKAKGFRLFSSGQIGLDAQATKTWKFDFSHLVSVDVFKLFTSKDPAKIKMASEAVLKCAQINFEVNFGVPLILPSDEFFKTVARTKEGQKYLKSYRASYAFFMSTHETFLGLNLTPAEIRDVTSIMEQGNVIKAEAARAADQLAKKHAAERIEIYGPLIRFVRDKHPLYAVTFVNSSHITVKQHIILRNIVDPDLRAAREREFIVELKNSVIAKAKAGTLTETEISDLFG